MTGVVIHPRLVPTGKQRIYGDAYYDYTYFVAGAPDLEIKVYRSHLNRSYHANVLMSQRLPYIRPARGNRPLVDQGSGRWWWDFSHSIGTRKWQVPTIEDAYALVMKDVTELLDEMLLPWDWEELCRTC